MYPPLSLILSSEVDGSSEETSHVSDLSETRYNLRPRKYRRKGRIVDYPDTESDEDADGDDEF